MKDQGTLAVGKLGDVGFEKPRCWEMGSPWDVEVGELRVCLGWKVYGCWEFGAEEMRNGKLKR